MNSEHAPPAAAKSLEPPARPATAVVFAQQEGLEALPPSGIHARPAEKHLFFLMKYTRSICSAGMYNIRFSVLTALVLIASKLW